MRLSRILVTFFSLLFISCATSDIRSTIKERQPKISFSISEDNIPLRKYPKLSGRIVSLLNKGDKLNALSKGSAVTLDSEFAWIYIVTQKGKGWISGEYISETISEEESNFTYIEDAFISIASNVIKIGMPRKAAISILGNPTSEEYTEKEHMHKYIYDGGNIILISNTNRVTYVGIGSPKYTLENGFAVGKNIVPFIDENTYRVGENGYIFYLGNRLRSYSYNSLVYAETDTDGVINNIQIAHPRQQ